MRVFGKHFAIVSAGLLFGATNSAPLLAAQCTMSELDQIVVLMSSDKRCDQAYLRKVSTPAAAKAAIKEICSACSGQVRRYQQLGNWIAKHPACAAEMKLSESYRIGKSWMKGYEDLCH